VLGNPVGFIKGLKDGAIGLFYQPIQVIVNTCGAGSLFECQFDQEPITWFDACISLEGDVGRRGGGRWGKVGLLLWWPRVTLSVLHVNKSNSLSPLKGAVLGPGEFFEGLSLGGRQFVGGTLGKYVQSDHMKFQRC